MGYYDDYFKNDRGMVECPVCHKKFLPAPYHAYKIGNYDLTHDEYADPPDHHKLVCTYSCMRKWEKEQEAKRKAKAEARRIAKEKAEAEKRKGK